MYTSVKARVIATSLVSRERLLARGLLLCSWSRGLLTAYGQIIPELPLRLPGPLQRLAAVLCSVAGGWDGGYVHLARVDAALAL